MRRPQRSTLFPYTTLSGSGVVLTGTRLAAGDLDVEGVTTDGFVAGFDWSRGALAVPLAGGAATLIETSDVAIGRHSLDIQVDPKSTRLNSSPQIISFVRFC